MSSLILAVIFLTGLWVSKISVTPSVRVVRICTVIRIVYAMEAGQLIPSKTQAYKPFVLLRPHI